MKASVPAGTEQCGCLEAWVSGNRLKWSPLVRLRPLHPRQAFSTASTLGSAVTATADRQRLSAGIAAPSAVVAHPASCDPYR